MLMPMATPRGSVPAPAWGPMWARVLAGIVLVPAAILLTLGVRFFVQGFGPETLAGIGLIVGPILVMMAAAIAVPAGLFLARRGKARFIIAVVVTVLSTAIVLFYSE